MKDYDKDKTLQQKIAEAEKGADTKGIHRGLLETGSVPNRWRARGNLLKRELRGLSLELQVSCPEL
jgi:hypothetical protein